MRKLLWKEWNEQSWKLAFGCIVLTSLAFIGLRARIVADDTMAMWVCFIGFTLLPILSSTGLVPAERSDGTLESLLALPVPPRQILAAKTLIGLLLCIGPMLAAAIASLSIAGNREMTAESMVILYVQSTITAASLFVWMQAITIRLPSEARAAMVALGVLIIWLMVSAGLKKQGIPMTVASISPFCWFIHLAPDGNVLPPPLVLALSLQLLIAAILWSLASRSLANAGT